MVTKPRQRSKQAAAPASSSKQAPESSTAATASAQPIQLDQSTQLVQSLLHSGISCVAFLRQLFPDACFVQRTYENCHDHWDYDEWVAGKKGKDANPKRFGACVPILKRGYNEDVDRILDWLEKGVFDALRKGYLKTFSFQIIENENRPSEVLETYDFRVSYTEPEGAVLVEVSMPDGKPTSIWNARVSFIQMVRKLCIYCPNLADLPRRRSIRIQLAYNDSCPDAYEPPGFTAGTSDSLAFPSSDGWARKTTSMGEMATGHHGLTLRVNHIEQQDPNPEGNQIPTNLKYEDVTSLLEEFDDKVFQSQDVKMANMDRVTDQPDAMPRVSEEVLETDGHDFSHERREGMRKSSARPSQRANSGAKPARVTEYAHVPTSSAASVGKSDDTSRSNLQKGLARQRGVPSSTIGDGETQDIAEKAYLKKALQDTPADEGLPDTQPIDLRYQEVESQVASVKQGIVKELLREKLAALKSGMQIAGTSSPLKRRSTGIDLEGLGSSDVTHCECDWAGEDPEQMLQCQLCETWQHAFCYGYRGRADLRMPSNRLCYKCLTQGEDPKLFSHLQNLAMVRCGIRYIERFGYTDDAKFAEGLETDRQTATKLSIYLKAQKYLVPVQGQKKTKRAAPQGPRHIVETGPARTKMMSECFDPFKHIGHLYVTRSEVSGIQASGSTLASDSGADAQKNSAQERKISRSNLASRPSRKGKERATSMPQEQSLVFHTPTTHPQAHVAMQTPRPRKRTQEEWAESVGRRVTPKRACKNSVSIGFTSIVYMSSPAAASAATADEEMEL